MTAAPVQRSGQMALSPLMTTIAPRSWMRAALHPNPDDRLLFTDTCFVGEPYSDQLAHCLALGGQHTAELNHRAAVL
jgi:hypothetical protein